MLLYGEGLEPRSVLFKSRADLTDFFGPVLPFTLDEVRFDDLARVLALSRAFFARFAFCLGAYGFDFRGRQLGFDIRPVTVKPVNPSLSVPRFTVGSVVKIVFTAELAFRKASLNLKRRCALGPTLGQVFANCR